MRFLGTFFSLPRFLLLFIFVSLLLFFYSFTQIDLGLTLTRASFLTTLQRSFQHIGYFDRPLSALFFVLILSSLFVLYVFILRKTQKGLVKRDSVWVVIIVLTIVLTFSYNAFSYDLFNYIFDAKIITKYHENPYFFKALDFPGDPMLSFMHWTHRTYPYGPFWLVLSVPLSFLGLGYFVLTYYLFKIAIASFFLGSCYLIEKILRRTHAAYALFGLVFFALNPLVLIESLVSSHNDIVMIFFVLLSIWFFVDSAYKKSVVTYVFSVGVKFATIVLLPVVGYLIFIKKRKQQIVWERVFHMICLCMLCAVLAATNRTTFQPWYLLYIIFAASFIAYKSYVLVPIISLSLFGILNYLPYIYFGVYDANVTNLIASIDRLSLLIAAMLFILLYAKTVFQKKS